MADMRAFDAGGSENDANIAVVEALFPITCRDLDAGLIYFIDKRIHDTLLHCLCLSKDCPGSFDKS